MNIISLSKTTSNYNVIKPTLQSRAEISFLSRSQLPPKKVSSDLLQLRLAVLYCTVLTNYLYAKDESLFITVF